MIRVIFNLDDEADAFPNLITPSKVAPVDGVAGSAVDDARQPFLSDVRLLHQLLGACRLMVIMSELWPC